MAPARRPGRRRPRRLGANRSTPRGACRGKRRRASAAYPAAVPKAVHGVGGSWHVRRRWSHRVGPETLYGRFRRRFLRISRRARDAADVDVVPDGCGVDALEAVALVLVALLVIAVLAFVIVPLLVAVVEVAVLLMLAALATAARIPFRRPWTIDAVGPNDAHHVWRVRGWRASRRACDHIASALATGRIPTQEEVTAATLSP